MISVAVDASGITKLRAIIAIDKKKIAAVSAPTLAVRYRFAYIVFPAVPRGDAVAESPGGLVTAKGQNDGARRDLWHV